MTVAVNQDYPDINALRVLKKNGEPLEGATLKIYDHTAYFAQAGVVPIAETTTDANGKWNDVIYLDDGRTWVLVVEKTTVFGPKKLEITT